MNRFVEYVTERVSSNVVSALQNSESGELRRVFHGPCVELLSAVFARFEAAGGIAARLAGGAEVVVPVLLQVPRLMPGEINPAINQSGKCDSNHLMTLRNSPACPRFLVLMPPASHAMLSFTSAADEFGVGPAANSGNATIGDWLGDAFVRTAFEEVLDRLGFRDESGRHELAALFEAAVQGADEVSHHDASREHSWAVIARLFEIPTNASDAARLASLACGVPPTGDGKLRSKDQLSVLRTLASQFMEDGIRTVFEELKQDASDDDKAALTECLQNIESRCSLPPEFEQAPTSYYGPGLHWTLPAAPWWWQHLSVETWTELIRDERTLEGALSFRCTNSIVGHARGINAIVLDRIELAVGLPDGMLGPVDATVSRSARGPNGNSSWSIRIGDLTTTSDAAVPIHCAPVRYSLEAPGFKKSTIRIISLTSWLPGVFFDARTASKASPPKAARMRSGVGFEASLVLEGSGRHYVDAYVGPGVVLGETAECSDADGQREVERDASVAKVSDHEYGFEVDAKGECSYELSLQREGQDPVRVRLSISCAEATPEGCSSEFERLIRLNRQGPQGRATTEVQVNRVARAADLQSWLLDEQCVERSFLPVVLAPDLEKCWRKPSWASLEEAKFSNGSLLCDPRPRLDEMVAPKRFLAARRVIAERIRGADEDGLVEAARLGEWVVSEPDFERAVAEYVEAYAEWLSNEPTIAPWADVAIVNDLESDGRTLVQEPDAVLLSPLHPVRLAWQVAAQRALWEVHRRREHCPAASILDPRPVPDVLFLPVRTPAGRIKQIPFFAVDSNSDYWGVLWNANQLKTIPLWLDRAPFDRDFGIQVGGVASGFSVSQVGRALNDVAEMLSAKPTLNVLISSAAGQTNACNEGFIEWGRSRLAGSGLALQDKSTSAVRCGARRLQILDKRSVGARPDDAEIANLAEDTANAVRWLDASVATRVVPDLGIIAQLESANGAYASSEVRSPLAVGALFRHRVRRQLAAGGGAFLAESRSAAVSQKSGDSILDGVVVALERLENMGETRAAYTFAPSVDAVKVVLDRAAFAAVSSSAVDPACFLGEWLKGSYLWDYELPSYSHRAGASNGYYLLSRVKDVDVEALQRALSKLPGCEQLTDAAAGRVLEEVASRGIPTVRGLSSGDHGASGDLGLFVAARLLQDEFRSDGAAGLLRVAQSENGRELVNLVLPVDPFRGYLEDLQASVGMGASRPDLIVASFDVTGGVVRGRLTPVEVKYRGEGNPMAGPARRDGLGQAKALSLLLSKVREKGQSGQLLWKLTFEHLLMTMVGFGLRVYSQKRLGAEQGREWSQWHELIASAILGDAAQLEVDMRGRLIVIDASTASRALDEDDDGFPESIVISMADASTIVRESDSAAAQAIRQSLGFWDLLPSQTPPASKLDGVAQPSGLVPSRVIPIEEPGFPVEPVEPFPPSPVWPDEVTPVPAKVDGAGFDVAAVAATAEDLVPAAPLAPLASDGRGLSLHVGSTHGTFQAAERRLELGDTRLNQLNIGVVGDLGTGKTQLLKSLILQIAKGAAQNQGVKPRVLVFDYKKDYSTDDFVAAVGARVVSPYHLPLNLFDTNGLTGQVAPWLQRYKFFADTLAKIFSGIGPVQLQNLRTAVRNAYSSRADGAAPTIGDVRGEYIAVLGSKGADAPLSIIEDLVDMEVFDPSPPKGSNFDSFMDGVVVVSLGDLGQDDRTKNMVVAILLNMFYEHMLRIPKRPYVGNAPQLRVVDSFLLVDEADSIMKYEFDVLRKLLLQGREFGVGIILASQFLRHFKAGATDYREPLLSWFVHKVPNVTPQEIAALGLADGLVEMANEVKTLPNHHCLFKTVGIDGEIVRATPFYELVVAK